MKQKLNRMFLCIALLMYLITVMTGTVSAADLYAFSSDSECSISITLKCDNTPVAGAEVTVYRVADITPTVDGYTFSYCNGFSGPTLSVEILQNPNICAELFATALSNGISGRTAVSDNNGFVSFENLEVGLYLVAQTGTVVGFTAFKPFLVYLPVTEGYDWKYHVDATPKVDIDRIPPNPPDNPPDEPDNPPHDPEDPSQGIETPDEEYGAITVIKLWNDDGENRPESVTVQLLNEKGVYDEVVLSASNGWSYTWYSLDGYENWYVQEINVPNGYTVTYYIDGYIYTVVNTPTLVQTGQLKWPVPVLGICGLVLCIAGFILRNAGRKRIDGN